MLTLFMVTRFFFRQRDIFVCRQRDFLMLPRGLSFAFSPQRGAQRGLMLLAAMLPLTILPSRLCRVGHAADVAMSAFHAARLR